MIVELHILQNFAPSNLNRDDTGQPKACDFGGFRRARISSQCLKRAIREEFKKSELVSAENLATRTKQLERAVAERAGRSPDEVAPVVQAALRGLRINLDAKTKQPSYLLFLSQAEIERFAAVCRDHWDALAEAAKSAPADEAAEASDAEAQATRRGRGAAAKKETAKLPNQVEQALAAVLDNRDAPHPSVDLSLFGRMLADLPIKNVDAAAQVAHALSTNEVDVEFDFYTAVDELNPRETTGAGMLGTIEFNSACFYRYANVDVDQLARNIGRDGDLTRQAVEGLIRAAVAAVPTGKQNSMAAHNPPSFVFAVVRRNGFWNLANAFMQPVRPGQGRDLASRSVDALAAHWRALGKMYGYHGVVGGWAVALDGRPSIERVESVDSIEELIAGVMGALGPTRAGQAA